MAAADLKAEDLGSCPFCDGKVSISIEPEAVLHSMPPCKKYLKESADVFLRNVRLAKVGTLPDDSDWPPPGTH